MITDTPIQFGIAPMIGASKPSIERLVEAVNLLQGATDPDQRAVRMYEFEARVSALEARLKAAGF
jgi:hypothetical protein